MSFPASSVPLDPGSVAALAASGLACRTIGHDAVEYEPYVAVVERAFLGDPAMPESARAWREGYGENRLVAVIDESGARPEVPVGTVNSWGMDVTIDAGSTLPMWSISAVTVSPTHRRRGIARALLEGELRAAHGAGVPIAGLTCSEATIYGRFGFGAAVHTADWIIDAHRAGWVGPAVAGRLDHVYGEDLARDLETVGTATAAQRPGDIAGWPLLWQRTAGVVPGKTDRKVRGVRYTDTAGELRGVMAYSVEENPADDSRNTLTVHAALTDGPDAYAALWRFALEHDLVATVRAPLRSRDEPLRWLIADQRALVPTERDHHWLRILDVPACFAARTLRVPGAVTFTVTDPLGFTAGDWRLEVDASGSASVEKVDDGGASAGEDGHVALGVSELSSLLLGGVKASTLRAAGRIAASQETAAWLDLTLAPVRAPQLSYWY